MLMRIRNLDPNIIRSIKNLKTKYLKWLSKRKLLIFKKFTNTKIKKRAKILMINKMKKQLKFKWIKFKVRILIKIIKKIYMIMIKMILLSVRKLNFKKN